MRIFSIVIGMLLSGFAFAQDLEQRLYDAYRATEMDVWAQYIDSVNWETATVNERSMLINYEYGYTAHVVSIKQEDAAQRLNQLEQHLEAHRNKMDSGVYYAYQTGISCFKLSLEKRHITKQIKNIYGYIERAMQISPNDPFVLTMQGNVEFFNPFLGNKQKALQYYQKADSIYSIEPSVHNYPRWNIRAMQIPMEKILDRYSK
jgi:hypothetical protein